jgi:hypothetical protein
MGFIKEQTIDKECLNSSTEARLCDVTDCDECSHVYMYLGTHEHCCLLNRRDCELTDHSTIPEWCPLQKAPIGYPVVKQEWIRPI